MKKTSLVALALIQCLIVLSGCSIRDPSLHQSDSNEIADNTSSITNVQESDTTIDDTRYYKVYFKNFDGSVITSVEVEEGEPVSCVPQIHSPANAFFAGWDSSLNDICERKSINATFDFVSNVRNAIGFDSVYVREGEPFEIVISIAGKVNFSSAEFEIILNEDIDFIEISYCDSSAYCNYSTNNNKVYVAMAFANNVQETVDICSIKCNLKDENFSDNAIQIKVVDISYINETNDIVDAEFTVFNEKIIVLK